MIIAIAAITADGKIAHSQDDNTSWTSKEDKKFFSQQTKQAGVVIFGRTTWETIKRPLPDRHVVVMSRQAQNSPYQTVEFSSLSPNELINQLKERGYKDIFIAGGQQIYTLFMNHQLVDQLWLTIEPHLFGQRSISLLDELETPIKLKLIETQNLNENTLQLKYQINYQ